MGNSRSWTTKLNAKLDQIKGELKAHGVTTAAKRKAAWERAAIRPEYQRERARP